MAKERITIDGEGSIIEVERGKTYRIRHRLPPAVPGGKRKWSKMRTVHGNKAKVCFVKQIFRNSSSDSFGSQRESFSDFTKGRGA